MDIKELLDKPDELISAIQQVYDLDVEGLLADWDQSKHRIMWDTKRYPDREVVIEPEKKVFDELTNSMKTIDAVKDKEEVNRLPMALEQDIVNIHTAFTVGIEPSMEFTANDDKEQLLFETLGDVMLQNKTKYANKGVVRSWLSECMVAEYWYIDESERFWNGVYAKHGITGIKPNKVLKSTIWSPFRGDKLYPIFDAKGKMEAFGREYKRKDGSDDIKCMTLLDDTYIYQFEDIDGWEMVDKAPHGFNKIPVLYAERSEPLARKIKPLRERLEAIMSNYADCIDYHFFPYLLLDGVVENSRGKKKSRVIELSNGGDAKYLTWDQVPTTIKLEMDNILTQIYSLTNTPRISFDNLQSFGKSLSGTAFKFMFMGAHMAVENHAEEIGEFFQRRVNFLVDALGIICPLFKEASQSIMIEVDLVPYMIDNLKDRVEIAAKAIDGKVWSIQEGILFAGNADKVLEELEMIKEENGLGDIEEKPEE